MSTRDIVAATLCDAVNGTGAWYRLHDQMRTGWPHRADDFTRVLAIRNYMVIDIDETLAWDEGKHR